MNCVFLVIGRWTLWVLIFGNLSRLIRVIRGCNVYVSFSRHHNSYSFDFWMNYIVIYFSAFVVEYYYGRLENFIFFIVLDNTNESVAFKNHPLYPVDHHWFSIEPVVYFMLIMEYCGLVDHLFIVAYVHIIINNWNNFSIDLLYFSIQITYYRGKSHQLPTITLKIERNLNRLCILQCNN